LLNIWYSTSSCSKRVCKVLPLFPTKHSVL
jgi:hypothetical protein